ncbi:MAG TPA: FkbM family methyltransferase [Acidimicrobiales bacterium]|nr:FkbM family methyltransferase [Acidimicrobiales bacterium]
MSKTVTIFGRPFTVSGGEGDDYYRHLPDDGDVTDSVMAAIRPHVKADAVCLDVGANIGLYSLGLSALVPEGRVFAFEPSPSAFGHLQANLHVNGATNVVASNLAVSDATGTVDFHDFSFFSAGSFSSDEASLLSSESYGSESFAAATTTIDEFVADRGLERVDFVKIDVEGAELSVLEGAEKTLTTYRPTTVLEFNTFGFTIHQSVLPQVALARIKELFPHVFVLDRVDGALCRLETPGEVYDFLYDNGIRGPADNMLCSFDDLPVDRRYTRIPVTDPAELIAGLEAEIEAIRSTLSWRVTGPLREARRRLDPLLTRVQAPRRRDPA